MAATRTREMRVRPIKCAACRGHLLSTSSGAPKRRVAGLRGVGGDGSRRRPPCSPTCFKSCSHLLRQTLHVVSRDVARAPKDRVALVAQRLAVSGAALNREGFTTNRASPQARLHRKGHGTRRTRDTKDTGHEGHKGFEVRSRSGRWSVFRPAVRLRVLGVLCGSRLRDFPAGG
jgi:hypothetical protein